MRWKNGEVRRLSGGKIVVKCPSCHGKEGAEFIEKSWDTRLDNVAFWDTIPDEEKLEINRNKKLLATKYERCERCKGTGEIPRWASVL